MVEALKHSSTQRPINKSTNQNLQVKSNDYERYKATITHDISKQIPLALTLMGEIMKPRGAVVLEQNSLSRDYSNL